MMIQVVIGLPEYLKDEVLWVAREFRTNPLSHEPGGSDVVVEYHNENVYGYDWIKFPSLYIRKIWDIGISKIYIEYEALDESDQLNIIKKNIKRIFARKYKKENFECESFTEIWNSETSAVLPWKTLEEYDYDRKNNKQETLEEYIERQQNSLAYENYLIKEAIKQNEFDKYLRGIK